MPPSCPSAAKNGGTNFFLHHRGSPGLLAGLVLLCGHALWCSVYALYHRWPAALARTALPAAAFLPLLAGESVCHRLLAAPDVHAPLAALHSLLGLAQ
jgi:hypothetical protein